MRPHTAARAARGEPSDEHLGPGTLGLELEGRERRVGALPGLSSLGLDLEGRERREGTHPDLRPLDLMVNEEASPGAGFDRGLHVTQDAPSTTLAARSPVQARPAVAAPAAPATTPTALAPAAAGPMPAAPAPAAGPTPIPPAPADGEAGAGGHGAGGELPETPEEARAYVERLVRAHGEAGARARVEQAILSRAMLLMHAPPEAQREAARRVALVRAELGRVAAESAALRERFGVEAGRVAEHVLADGESEIAAALMGYGCRPRQRGATWSRRCCGRPATSTWP